MDDYESSYPPRSEKHNLNKKNENTLWDDIFSIIKYTVVLSIIFFLVHRYLFAPVMVDGDSMEPTLSDGDYLLLNKFSDVERFDIVVFPPPDDQEIMYIKRVIGLPGDTISYHEDTLYVNGEPTEEPFLEHEGSPEVMFFSSGDFSLLSVLGEEKVPEGHYFVLGDNRLNSRDSRDIDVGFIEEDSIVGQTNFRYWPFDKLGLIE